MIDFDGIFERKRFDVKIFIAVAAAVVIGLYVVDLAFGPKSISKLIDLENSVKIMQKKVKNLKKQNALLQKEYFELKELEGG